MRKRTLAGLCSILGFVIVFALKYAGFPVSWVMSGLFVFLVIVPLLMIPMTLLNKRLLAWRKVRGRDIEDEERYENEDAGIISLRPRPESADQSEVNRQLPPIFR